MQSLSEAIMTYRNGIEDEEDVVNFCTRVTSKKRIPPLVVYANEQSKNMLTYGINKDIKICQEISKPITINAKDENGDIVSFPMYPIFIPTKGRFGKYFVGTASILAEFSIPFTLVVEPQEAEQYCSYLMGLPGYNPANSSIGVLPLGYQGISYVRNHILNIFSPSSGFFWVLDDDIRGFSLGDGNNKNESISPISLFYQVYKRMKNYPNVSIFSLEYEQFAYPYSNRDIAINSYNNIAVLIKKEDVDKDIQYRFRIREDYDFTLQMIRHGHTTIRFRNLSFRVPQMAECKGGMTDYYIERVDDIREQNSLFIKEWPSVASEVIKYRKNKKSLRYDIRVNWMVLNPNRVINKSNNNLHKNDSLSIKIISAPLTPAEILNKTSSIFPPIGKLQALKNTQLIEEELSLSQLRNLKRSDKSNYSKSSFKKRKKAKSKKSRRNKNESDDDEDSEENEEDEEGSDENSLEEESEEIFNFEKKSSDADKIKKPDDDFNKSPDEATNNLSLNVPIRRPRKSEIESAVSLSIPNDKNAPGWKGYCIVLYREVSNTLAESVGLKVLDNATIGEKVAFIPESMEIRPSVQIGTVIVSHKDGFQVVPNRRYRDVPIQNVKKVYISEIDPDACAKILDAKMEAPPPNMCHINVTKNNLADVLKKFKSPKKAI